MHTLPGLGRPSMESQLSSYTLPHVLLRFWSSQQSVNPYPTHTHRGDDRVERGSSWWETVSERESGAHGPRGCQPVAQAQAMPRSLHKCCPQSPRRVWLHMAALEKCTEVTAVCPGCLTSPALSGLSPGEHQSTDALSPPIQTCPKATSFRRLMQFPSRR